jgi:hypothetical protein
MLMITVAFLGLILPFIAVLLFNPSDHSAGKRLSNRATGKNPRARMAGYT